MLSDFTANCLANELEARRCICAALARIRGAGLSAERAGDVELVLAEAINNIVEHAYDGTGCGRIRLHIMLTSDHLVIRLRDSGRPFPEGQVPAPRLIQPSRERGILPEGGFGWFLIKSLTSAVRYDRDAEGNVLSLYFEIHARDLPSVSDSDDLP